MASSRAVAHPSVEERKAAGKRVPGTASLASHQGWVPAPGPPGSGRAARGAGPHAGARPGAGAARADDGLAVHVLPGRGQDHGGRPQGHADGGARRCSSAATRTCRTSVCSPRPSGAAVRPERLRRDAAGPVRVRREADGGELHDRGAQQRLHQGRGARRDARLGAAYREAMARVRRRCARWTSGTPTCPSRS